MNGLAEVAISSVDWSKFLVYGGSAGNIGPALHDLLSSTGVEEAQAAWDQIEEHVFSNERIYSAAEPTTEVMMAALTEDQPLWRSGRILDLLFFIVQGSSPTDPMLQGRCRARAREGLWLLAAWAVGHDGWMRQNALEVIELVAPDRVDMIRTATTFGGAERSQ